ncbi:MAG TPA: Eco57I restriction-modification methylase domain-containing protein, partial [Kofleriaceae bacterium]|nr:Eco57I restriction-modification methylase domain-containing protein [Kofleriaceae bacterium]
MKTAARRPDAAPLGVVYTPAALARAMVELALAPLVEGKPPNELLALRVCDPACGEGVFLAAARDVLVERLVACGVDAAEALREVCARCLVGVDVDARAIEIARASVGARAPELARTSLGAHASSTPRTSRDETVQSAASESSTRDASPVAAAVNRPGTARASVLTHAISTARASHIEVAPSAAATSSPPGAIPVPAAVAGTAAGALADPLTGAATGATTSATTGATTSATTGPTTSATTGSTTSTATGPIPGPITGTTTGATAGPTTGTTTGPAAGTTTGPITGTTTGPAASALADPLTGMVTAPDDGRVAGAVNCAVNSAVSGAVSATTGAEAGPVRDAVTGEPDAMTGATFVVADALTFDWATLGAFDVVIGNPPYIRQERLGDKGTLRTYAVYDGVADLYVYFLELAHRMVRPGGRYCFVTPNKWLTVSYAAPLRAYLAKQASVEGVVDLTAVRVFEEDAFPCVVWGTRRRQHASIEAARGSLSTPRVPHERDRWAREPWHIDEPEDRAVIDALAARWPPLGSVVTPARGLVTGANHVFVIDEATRARLLADEPAVAELVRPLVKGRDLRPYAVPPTGRYVLLIDRGTSIEHLPALLAYLAPFREQLEPGRGRKPGRYRWYELQDP